MLFRPLPLFTIAGFFVFATASADAGTILYPGTFDPFHASHLAELRAAIERFPGDDAVVLPIQWAPYRPAVKEGKLQQPQLFGFEMKSNWIRAALADDPKVRVEGLLGSISEEPLLALTKAADQFGPDVKLLIGSDVLELWAGLPGFEELLKKVALIVSNDMRTPEVNASLKIQFANHSNVHFLKEDIPPVRSVDVNRALLADDAKALETMLPRGAIRWATIHPDLMRDAESRFIKELETYLRAFTREKILPEFVRAGMPQELADWIIEDDFRSGLLQRIGGGDQSGLSKAATRIQRTLPASLRSEYTRFLDTNLFAAALRPDIAELTKYCAVGSAILDAYRARMRRPGFVRAAALKVASSLQTASWTLIWKFYKRFRPYAKNSWTEEALNLDRGFAVWAPDPGEGMITVYRGVNRRPHLDEFLKSWTEGDGFLSKIALEQRLSGKTLLESLAESRRHFEKRSVSANIVNQVVGDWVKSSSLISTSLDKSIAERAAGIGGYVLTIRVPVDQGYFANDFAYWENSTWKNVGNPNARLHEFDIRDRIPPENIIAYEMVEKLPDRPVAGSFETAMRLLRGVPARIRDRCLKLFMPAR